MVRLSNSLPKCAPPSSLENVHLGTSAAALRSVVRRNAARIQRDTAVQDDAIDEMPMVYEAVVGRLPTLDSRRNPMKSFLQHHKVILTKFHVWFQFYL